jgi:hypothetical protein
LTVSRRWSLFTVISSSSGSPSCTTERDARAAIEYDEPTAPAKLGGLSVSGTGRTSSVRCWSVARKVSVRATGKPKASRPWPISSSTTTDAGGITIGPALRAVTCSGKRKRS